MQSNFSHSIMEPARAKTRAEIAILKLKEVVRDLYDPYPEFQDDLYLLRWLKARQMDVKAAEKMLRESLKWREEYVNQIIYDDVDPGLIKVFEHPKSYCKNGTAAHPKLCYWCSALKVDFVDTAKVDLRTTLRKFGKDEVFKYIVQLVMKAEEENIRINKQAFEQSKSDVITEDSIQGGVLVLDIKNVTFKQVTSLRSIQFMQHLCRHYLNYFPSLGNAGIVVNCPKMALFLTNLLIPMVEGPYLRVEVYGHNEEEWKQALLQRVDENQLPVLYGGTTK